MIRVQTIFWTVVVASVFLCLPASAKAQSIERPLTVAVLDFGDSNLGGLTVSNYCFLFGRDLLIF